MHISACADRPFTEKIHTELRTSDFNIRDENLQKLGVFSYEKNKCHISNPHKLRSWDSVRRVFPNCKMFEDEAPKLLTLNNNSFSLCRTFSMC